MKMKIKCDKNKHRSLCVKRLDSVAGGSIKHVANPLRPSTKRFDYESLCEST